MAHVTDAATDRDVLGIDGMAEDLRPALCRGQKPRQHFHRRRLAAAVRAEKTEDLAARDLETDIIDGREITEAHGQMIRLDRDVTTIRPRTSRNPQRFVSTALLLRQQGDECRIECRRCRSLPQLVRCPRIQYAPAVHGDQPVEALGLFHVGGRHDDAHAGPACSDAVDQFPELPARQWVDAGRRFVEDQKIGIVDEGTAEAELLLHASRQLTRRTVSEGLQPCGVQKPGDAPLALAAILTEQATKEFDILVDRKCRIKVLAQALRHIGDARAGFAPV